MENKHFEKLIRNIQASYRCPHCGARYDVDDIHYFGQAGPLVLLHLQCHNCHTPVLASVMMAGGVIKEELLPESKEPVRYDDVLKLHRFLETFDGDFKNLWFK